MLAWANQPTTHPTETTPPPPRVPTKKHTHTKKKGTIAVAGWTKQSKRKKQPSKGIKLDKVLYKKIKVSLTNFGEKTNANVVSMNRTSHSNTRNSHV